MRSRPAASRRLLPVLAAAVLVLLPPAAAPAGEPARLTVMHTNDLHGQLRPVAPSPVRAVLRNRPAGGFAHLASMVRAARREAEERGASLVLLDGGDIFQGTPIGNETRGTAVVEAMNALGYDAGALGNHEFDYGPRTMLRLVARANFPILAANVSGDRRVRPYVVLAPPKTPCRVAVIGLTTPATPWITTRGATKGFRFADPVPVVRSLLREVDADLFVVASHLGRDDELRLAREVDGIALICGGHSHTPYTQKIGDTLLVQTQGRGVTVARADLDLEPGTWKVLRAEARLLPVDPSASEPDPRVEAVIDRYGKDLEEAMAKVVGRLAAPLRRTRELASSTAGSWIADVLRRAGEAEIGFMNRGGIRCDLEPGPISAGELYGLMPFDNRVFAMDLTGAQVRSILERNFGRRPSLEWSGMVVEVEPEGDGARIVAVRVGDAPLDRDRTYRVATNSFVASGGDGYFTFRDGTNRRQGALIREVLADDLAANSPLTPPTDARLLVRERAERR